MIIYEGDLERSRQGTAVLAKGDVGEDEDEDEDDDEEEEENTSPGPAFSVKSIDFAHTKMVAGEGPGEGVLVGMYTTLGSLGGMIL